MILNFLFWFASAVTVAHPPTAVTPESITSQISASGAHRTLEVIYADSARWEQVLSSVELGDPKWLKVANQLRTGADAGPAEQLELAVGEALAHQPKNVLQISVPTFTLESVCGGPDVDDQRFNSYELSIRAIEDRKARLRGVTDTKLIPNRDRCLGLLEKSKIRITQFFGASLP